PPAGLRCIVLRSAEKTTCHLCSGSWSGQTGSVCSGRSMMIEPRTRLPLGRDRASIKVLFPKTQPFGGIVKVLSDGRWAWLDFFSVQVPASLAGGRGGATTRALTTSVAT